MSNLSPHIKPKFNQVVILHKMPSKFIVQNGVKFEVPDEAMEETFEGTICAVGPLASQDLKVGQQVLFSRYAGVDGPSPNVLQRHWILLEDSDIKAEIDPVAMAAITKELEDEKNAERAAAEAERVAAEDGIAAERARVVGSLS